MTHLGHFFAAYGYSTHGFNLFLAKGLAQGQQQLDVEEADLVTAAFSFNQIIAMIDAGEIKDAATIASLGLMHMKRLL